MATIRTSIELQDNFTGIMNNIINAVNMSVSMMEQMQQAMNAPVDTASLEGVRDQLNQAAIAAQELDAAMSGLETPPTPTIPTPEPPPHVEVPVVWQSDSLEVFTNSGVERFQSEVQSANNMLNTLNNTQNQIATTAAQTNLFPPNMVADMNGMQSRLQAIQQRIQQIESNPLNMGSDVANAELEQLRGQLDQAVYEQEILNRAVDNMDVQAANAAYLRLSQTVGNTERYIRDNVSEQGRFNREIQEGVGFAGNLQSIIAGTIGAFAGMAGIRKAISFIQDSTAAFDTQLNAETQLISVLANMLDEDYVAQFELEVTADTTGAIDDIAAIQNSVDEVIVPVSAETSALTTAFNTITDKASEIQSRGIYGDEIMIAAAAEFSTYFTDVDAITMMMDTLANYAMGMSGGGAIDSTGMVDYATNLGKIMSGAYDAMTKKGFELSDTQKSIIEGTATQEQIVATLGEEYLTMSQDMQAAASISQIIEESWAGLYENMSNTPQGKIIQLTNAWGDMKEVIGGQLYPYVLLFVDAITENWATIEAVIQGIVTGLEFLLGMLSWVLEAALAVGDAIVENWSWISPIIYGVAGALAVYYGWLLLTKGAALAMAEAQALLTGAKMLAVPIYAALTGATMAETAAQWGLNAALYACPIVWIIILIIALIALFYAAVAAVNHFTGTTVSATGIICGAFMVALAFIGNIFVALWNLVVDVFVLIYNLVAEVANFIGNVFTDPIGAICRLFFGLADIVLGILQALASAIDAIFGSNLAGSVQGWRDSLSGWVDDTFGKGDEIMAKMNADDMKLRRFEYGAAWDAGYSFGEGIDESIANFDPSSLFGTTDIPSPEDYASSYAGLDGIGSGVDDIVANTGAIKDSMDITEEDLKYLRDIAEQEVINRFTTAEITIKQTNNNNISSSMDLDGVVDGLTNAMNEAVVVIAEGVHA